MEHSSWDCGGEEQPSSTCLFDLDAGVCTRRDLVLACPSALAASSSCYILAQRLHAWNAASWVSDSLQLEWIDQDDKLLLGVSLSQGARTRIWASSSVCSSNHVPPSPTHVAHRAVQRSRHLARAGGARDSSTEATPQTDGYITFNSREQQPIVLILTSGPRVK